MTPGKFLRLIWPEQGFYCIAHPFRPEGSKQTVYAHKVFATISEAVTHVHEQQHVQDVYFAILPLAAERVWDAEKTDWKTGTKGAWAVRKQSNSLCSKCSFFDLDVGTEDHKYDTQRDALAALLKFLDDTGLPMPVLVSSGGGVHVYWPYDTAVPVEEWRQIATDMRALAEGLGLKVDPTRTTDSSSVLRVPDTFNWKDRSNPRPVKVLQEGSATPVATFKQIVSDAMIRHGIEGRAAKQPGIAAGQLPEGFAPQTFNDFGAPPTLNELASACAQVRQIVMSQGDKSDPFYGPLDNTAWYRGLIGTISHTEDGDNNCRKLTSLHPRDVADIETKLLQTKTFPPAKCATLREFMPWKDTPCHGCRFYNLNTEGKWEQAPGVPNPLAACRKTTLAPQPVAGGPVAATPPPPPTQGALPDTTASSPATSPAAPPAPPMQLMAPGAAIQAVLIPNPPKPYERLKTGGVAVTRLDKDDNETTTVIYPHDLYPVKRLVNAETGTEQQLWRATLPRSGAKEFLIDAAVLYDGRQFSSALASHGLYPNKADLPALQDYMVAYISQLQRDLDADNQMGHLGWTDGYRQFVLPDKVLLENGSVRNSSLTEGARRAAQFLTKRGDLRSQIALLDFYKHPDYLPNQFAILCGLASIVFYATGNHGVVVNMSGESGASKSTTLYTMAGMWGDPTLWPINGTNRGATANARAQRIITNANLPTAVDEITHLPPKEAIDLVMNITQPGHRLRLGTDGAEKQISDNYKSAIMVSTSNSNLHGLLSTDNAAGTAGSMRVFEMKMTSQRVHTKAEADEFLRQIRQHHGHIGEVFTHWVVRNRATVEKMVQMAMARIDSEGAIQSSERYWSAVIAVVLVAGDIAKMLGLCSYETEEIKTWALRVQVPYMRGVVKEEYRDPLAVLTDYIAEKQGNIVVVSKATSIGQNTSGAHTAGESAYPINRPSGSLLGHFDQKAGTLHLLKQGFKDHCSRIGASSSRILDELAAPRVIGGQQPRPIVTNRAARRTLGAGTDFAKGQTWCFTVDMTHPEIAGVQPTLAAVGGQPVSPGAGHLQVVK
jgi:hypothetical protein